MPSGSTIGRFGSAVHISHDAAVVGDRGATSQVWPGPGAAFVFVRQGEAWTQQAILHSDVPSSHSSAAVAISGDVIVVGDWLAGRVYIFERTGTAWTQTAKFVG